MKTPKYCQPKAVIGVGKVRRWKWTAFKNPARTDDLTLYHWRREKPEFEDPADEYPFARYNKHVTVPDYTSSEYETMLQDPKWTEAKTAHLMDLARRFDLRFVHMRDRWDSERFPGRPSIEDLKERYYGILITLDKARGTNLSNGLRYDAAHERRRKLQLSLLYGRTREQVEEEQTLVQELHKIEARRRERERKKQDLQKLISQADAIVHNQEPGDWAIGDAMFDTTVPVSFGSGNHSTAGTTGSGTGQRKRTVAGGSVSSTTPVSSTFYAHAPSADSSASLASLAQTGGQSSSGNASAPAISAITNSVPSNADLIGSLGSAASAASSLLAGSFSINFSDPGKNPGVHLRSQKMKLPSNLGQKKIRIVENFLTQLQVDPSPPATAEIVDLYNNLRSKILLLYEMRLVHLNCDFELQAARWRLDTFAPDQPLPRGLANVTVPAPPMTSNRPPGQMDEFENSAPAIAITSQIDPTILTALRECDSKRPIVPRYSLGVAGTLAAAAGTAALALSGTASNHGIDLNSSTTGPSDTQTPSTGSGLARKSTCSSPKVVGQSPDALTLAAPRSPSVQSTQPGSDSPVPHRGISCRGSGASPAQPDSAPESAHRRRRAAALEQSRVLKKLKIKGHLVD
ncbi:DNA methyltransferase 1-associated protein 1 [Fasciola gigantica]|uniref:DNA methyltransferase 1-associated protein 1 n=1 Tax=Fasciola gigantica TaxID=46835 RepID=A0A504YYZ2_FASGI|nr:DNA methyltransferase 1-associated protein 1 [Fasciola gigantica]